MVSTVYSRFVSFSKLQELCYYFARMCCRKAWHAQTIIKKNLRKTKVWPHESYPLYGIQQLFHWFFITHYRLVAGTSLRTSLILNVSYLHYITDLFCVADELPGISFWLLNDERHLWVLVVVHLVAVVCLYMWVLVFNSSIGVYAYCMWL